MSKERPSEDLRSAYEAECARLSVLADTGLATHEQVAEACRRLRFGLADVHHVISGLGTLRALDILTDAGLRDAKVKARRMHEQSRKVLALGDPSPAAANSAYWQASMPAAPASGAAAAPSAFRAPPARLDSGSLAPPVLDSGSFHTAASRSPGRQPSADLASLFDNSIGDGRYEAALSDDDLLVPPPPPKTKRAGGGGSGTAGKRRKTEAAPAAAAAEAKERPQRRGREPLAPEEGGGSARKKRQPKLAARREKPAKEYVCVDGYAQELIDRLPDLPEVKQEVKEEQVDFNEADFNEADAAATAPRRPHRPPADAALAPAANPSPSALDPLEKYIPAGAMPPPRATDRCDSVLDDAMVEDVSDIMKMLDSGEAGDDDDAGFT
eukprot:TRINITY_DN27820_c0_g1_i1.p1 TRINITY_DN27820_c0_g1~~TRINITY_DN27820_c0_g1_i1.p1  ORF type:complete len:383 (+),score=126.59 TRINITY_DN27820_c0_g1_i1:58-1206(+)